jgi:hypothetical protein
MTNSVVEAFSAGQAGRRVASASVAGADVHSAQRRVRPNGTARRPVPTNGRSIRARRASRMISCCSGRAFVLVLAAYGLLAALRDDTPAALDVARFLPTVRRHRTHSGAGNPVTGL